MLTQTVTVSLTLAFSDTDSSARPQAPDLYSSGRVVECPTVM